MAAAPNLPGALAYPQLAQIAEQDRVAAVLAERMGPAFSSGELRLGRVTIVRAYYRPAPRGDYRLLLRAHVLDRSGAAIGEQLLCGQIWPPSEFETRAEQARRSSLVRPRYGEPLVVIPAWRTILWAFPNDPELPRLAELATPDAVLARARTRPELFGLAAGAQVLAVDVRLAKYVPARRASFACRFRVDGGEHAVYAKAYRRREAQRAWWRQRAIWEGGARGSTSLRMAEPYAYDEEVEAIFQEALPGHPLTRWLDAARFPELTRRAGAVLASLHRIAAPLPLRRSLAAECDELSSKGDAVLHAFPRHAARCSALRERLLDAADALGEVRQVVVHGAFRLSHVLSDGESLALIDLDGACLGDPAHDLGRFAAQLLEARLAGRIEPNLAQRALEEMAAAYDAAGGEPVSEARLHWFTASQLVTGHLYKSVKRAESPHLEATLAAAESLASGAPRRATNRALREASIGTSAIPTDPALPDLDLLVDNDRMRALFEERLRAQQPGADLRIESLRREKLNYRVNRYCGALYRLALGTGSRVPRDQWFYLRYGRPDETEERFASESRRAVPEGCPPVAHWPDRQMIVWPFPNDPRLEQLAEVIDPDRMRARIETRPEAFGLTPDESVESVHWEPFKQMPGKRTVLRFEVASSRAPLGFFSKSYRDRRSARVYRALEATRAALAATGARLEIPRPLLHLDALHTYLQADWPGESLSGLHGTPALAAALPLLAGALGELHASRTGLPPASYVAETTSAAARDAERIALYWPDAASGARSIARRLARMESGLVAAERFPKATLHGAFRMSQLLRRQDRLALLDYDALATGDPHYDVAEFQASLLHQGFLRRLDLAQVRAHAEAFRQHYGSCVSWHLDEQRLAWFEGAFLLEKLYLALKNLEVRLYPRIEELLDFVNSGLDRVDP